MLASQDFLISLHIFGTILGRNSGALEPLIACNAGTVAGKLLVGHLRIVLLRLYELVVEVQVV